MTIPNYDREKEMRDAVSGVLGRIRECGWM